MLMLDSPRPAIPTHAPPRARAIVIGSGFGGLAAAVRLLARGYDVTVLERLAVPGGRAAVIRQDGFTFDSGPTIITAPFLFEELWALAGRRLSDDVRLVALDPMYTIRFDDGSELACSSDPDRMRAAIARLSPRDVAGYDRFMDKSRAIYEIGFERFGGAPFSSFMDMVRAGPDIVRLGGWMSVDAMASSFVRDPRIRFALGFHPLFVGGSPFSTTAVYCLISHLERSYGVHFAMGGTGALVDGLVGLIERMGGKLRTRAGVAEILVEEGRARGVRLESGEVLRADIVVSNADSATTYRKLVPARARRRWTDGALDRAKYSMSLFVWHFGTRRKYEAAPHHTILLGPRYEPLISDIFERKVLAEDFSLYLHRPTSTDPSLAPDGCDAFYVLSPVPHLDSGIDWASRAEPYRRAIEARLERRLLPKLSAQIVTSHVVTPLDFRDRLGSEKGAAFGLQPTLLQSAWFRPHNKSEDVEGLYLVGAGTHPGAGVPGVLSSARVLDHVVPDPAAIHV
jgi:phytoene desaturase